MRRPAPSGRLWLGWVWRDLRSQWVAVVAIGFVLAIGAGVYSGLGSTATWLRTSYDHSFDELSIHDIRFELSPGTFTGFTSLGFTSDDTVTLSGEQIGGSASPPCLMP